MSRPSSSKVKLFEPNPKTNAALVKASKSGDAKTLKDLLKAMKDSEERRSYANWPDKAGSTLIFHCAWSNHAKAMEVLIASGANINYQNLRMNTALHLACEQGRRDVIALLIDAGANTQLKNSFKQSCFETCSEDKRAEMKALIRSLKKTWFDRIVAEAAATIPQELQHVYHILFAAMDTDGDGYVTHAELQDFLTRRVVPWEQTSYRPVAAPVASLSAPVPTQARSPTPSPLTERSSQSHNTATPTDGLGDATALSVASPATSAPSSEPAQAEASNVPLFASPSFDVLPVDKLDEAAARRMSVYAPELSDLDIAEKRAEKPMPRVHVISEALDAEMHKLFDAQALQLKDAPRPSQQELLAFCQSCDLDGNEVIDFAEFLRAVSLHDKDLVAMREKASKSGCKKKKKKKKTP